MPSEETGKPTMTLEVFEDGTGRVVSAWDLDRTEVANLRDAMDKQQSEAADAH